MRGFESASRNPSLPLERGGDSNLDGLSERQIIWYKHMMKGVPAITPNLEEFGGLYSPEEIEKDNARVERRRHDFDRERDSTHEARDFRARLAEFLFARLGGMWLGGKVGLASEFDDYTNGVDLTFEVAGDDGLIHRLAIDITTGVDEALRKLRDIGLKLRDGELSEVKYFKSQTEGGFKGKIKVPKVVIFMENLDALAKFYYILRTTSDPAVKENAINFLGGAVQRLNFLTQVIGELRVTIDVLTSIGAEQGEIDELEKLLDFFIKKEQKLQELKSRLTKADDTGPQSSISSIISAWRP